MSSKKRSRGDDGLIASDGQQANKTRKVQVSKPKNLNLGHT